MPATVNVALFPIPSLVAFPGTVVPLHVFEPRYRQMLRDCVDEGRMIGVCHTRKTIREAKQNQTLAEAMHSNQATYQPQAVFSAGYCTIIETLEDGRLLAEIKIEQRLQIIREIQSLPYRIVASIPLLDEPLEDNQQVTANTELQARINQRLVDLIGPANPAFVTLVQGAEWQAMAPEEFSFQLFQTLRFNPDVMQMTLEARSTAARLGIILDLLNQ